MIGDGERTPNPGKSLISDLRPQFVWRAGYESRIAGLSGLARQLVLSAVDLAGAELVTQRAAGGSMWFPGWQFDGRRLWLRPGVSGSLADNDWLALGRIRLPERRRIGGFESTSR